MVSHFNNDFSKLSFKTYSYLLITVGGPFAGWKDGSIDEPDKVN